MFNAELIHNRIEELEAQIENFPESVLCDCWKSELSYLELLTSKYLI